VQDIEDKDRVADLDELIADMQQKEQ